ncbi:MAG: hypothetical protein E7012_03025 [Alphaproteobacteria bacterium]|nr:hypothetical protein [Alphaproteobacteria bacterium]
MLQLKKLLFYGVLALFSNIANASVTYIADSQYTSRDAPVMMMASPTVELCATSDKITCSGDKIVTDKSECSVVDNAMPIACCDSSDGTEKFDCLPLCSVYEAQFTSVKLFNNECSSVNAQNTGEGCKDDSTGTVKFACKCGDEYTETSAPDCASNGMEIARNDYECQAGTNGSLYLPVDVACSVSYDPCEEWEVELIKAQYDTDGNRQNYTTGCPDASEERICKYSFGNGERNVSFCACPRYMDGSYKHITCPPVDAPDSETDSYIGGGSTCQVEGETRYEYCFLNCSYLKTISRRETLIDVNELQTGCIISDGSILEQYESDVKLHSSHPLFTGTYNVYYEYAKQRSDTPLLTMWFKENNNNICLDEKLPISQRTPLWLCKCDDTYIVEKDKSNHMVDWTRNDYCKYYSGDNYNVYGRTCNFNPNLVLYEYCATECDTSFSLSKFDDCSDYNVSVHEFYAFNNSKACVYNGEIWYQCTCPDYKKTLLEHCNGTIEDNSRIICDSNCQYCMKTNRGKWTPCTADRIREPVIEGYSSDKYETFVVICSLITDAEIVDHHKDCKFGHRTCWETVDNIEYTSAYICFCPDNYKTIAEFCNNNADCISKTTGVGEPCTHEGKNKYGSFALTCPTDRPLFTSESECALGSVDYTCTDNGATKYVCKCPDNYKTFDEFCSDKDVDCKIKFSPVGKSCNFDGNNIIKYSDFTAGCPTDRPLFTSESECALGSVDYTCTDNGATKYVCKCPDNYKTFDEFCSDKDVDCKIKFSPVGKSCNFDGNNIIKYSDFTAGCPTDRPLFTSESECALGSVDYTCTDNDATKYVCKCPDNYKTFDEFCSDKSADCKTKFSPVGKSCNFDGNNIIKYSDFTAGCPTDRPLFTSESECALGSVDYTCTDNGAIKYVCKCPDTWVNENGKSANGTQICSKTEEASGRTCNYDSLTNLKYEQCNPRCDDIISNEAGVVYLPENEATEAVCKQKHGNGATFGFTKAQTSCSYEHKIMYPCYCGDNYTDTCEISDNKQPTGNALSCSINGKTYYSECELTVCAGESSTYTIIEDSDEQASPSELCEKAGFGAGSSGKRCGEKQIECSCNHLIYDNLCNQYPLSVPTNQNIKWCKYGDDNTLMKNGSKHYRTKQCDKGKILGKCGEYILNENGEKIVPNTIKITETSDLCIQKFGSAANPQICDYADGSGRKAYNCWFDPTNFIWTEETCPIRHVLGTKFLYKGNEKYFDECNCHKGYKYHQYNCSKKLSGGYCAQKITETKINEDVTLKNAIKNTKLKIGDNIRLYSKCNN